MLIGLAVAIALILQAFVAQAFFIPSSSMAPTLEPGDRVVVSRLAYRTHEVRRGDVVVFDDLRNESSATGISPGRVFGELLEAVGAKRPDEEELIKRVIGLPGDTLTLAGGSVYINGRRLDEPYLDPSVRTGPDASYEVPEGHFFMMGDNRTNSDDSRGSLGFVAEDRIVGRALAVAWPPNRSSFL